MSRQKEDFNSTLEKGNQSLLREFCEFARTHKKLWLLPIFLLLIVFGALIILGGSSAAPFIYRLF